MQQGREKKYLVNPLIAWKAGKHTHTRYFKRALTVYICLSVQILNELNKAVCR